MADLSHLDAKYFISKDTYNCPFCNRRSVRFELTNMVTFHWSHEKPALAIFVQCQGEQCGGISMHLTHEASLTVSYRYGGAEPQWNSALKFDYSNLDSYFFYHQPTSFFTLDKRIPRKVRELVNEAENSRRSGFLVGASACLRKAIYELLGIEGIAKMEADGKGGERERHYTDRVKELKTKRPQMDATFVDVLAGALTATSDNLHEESWEGWTPAEFDGVHESVLAVLHEMYVIPEQRKERASLVADMVSRMRGDKGKGVPVPAKEAARPADPR